MNKKKIINMLATQIAISVASSVIIGATCKLINKRKNVDKKNDTIDKITHMLQNIDDDEMIMPKSIISENFGNKEYSLVKLYDENRLFAKNIERETLIKYYAQTINLVDIDENNKYTSDFAIEMFYDNKPKVIMRNLTYCPSCHKMFDNFSDFDFDNADFNLIILISKQDADENTIKDIPNNLKNRIIITNTKDSLHLGLKRFPTTLFLDSNNRLFDIGGLISIFAIKQRLLDIPEFPKDYTVFDEIK